MASVYPDLPPPYTSEGDPLPYCSGTNYGSENYSENSLTEAVNNLQNTFSKAVEQDKRKNVKYVIALTIIGCLALAACVVAIISLTLREEPTKEEEKLSKLEDDMKKLDSIVNDEMQRLVKLDEDLVNLERFQKNLTMQQDYLQNNLTALQENLQQDMKVINETMKQTLDEQNVKVQKLLDEENREVKTAIAGMNETVRQALDVQDKKVQTMLDEEDRKVKEAIAGIPKNGGSRLVAFDEVIGFLKGLVNL